MIFFFLTMMDSYPRKKKDEGCSPQLLDLISKERQWLLKMKEDRCRVTSEEKKLELCLGPPGGDNWTSNNDVVVSKFNSKGNDQQTLLSFAPTTNTTSGTKRGFTDTMNGGGSNSQCQSHSHHVFSHSWSNSGYQGKCQNPQQTKISSSSSSSFLQLQSTSQCLPPPPPSVVMSKESSQHCCNKAVDLPQQSTEKKAFSPPSAAANTAVANSSAQKRFLTFFFSLFFFTLMSVFLFGQRIFTISHSHAPLPNSLLDKNCYYVFVLYIFCGP